MNKFDNNLIHSISNYWNFNAIMQSFCFCAAHVLCSTRCTRLVLHTGGNRGCGVFMDSCGFRDPPGFGWISESAAIRLHSPHLSPTPAALTTTPRHHPPVTPCARRLKVRCTMHSPFKFKYYYDYKSLYYCSNTMISC